ncbi:MAG TPA: alkaline phosphatase family protein [Candidatus Polarisedimenticolia bacterium]|nr:alkaline phosphatase family protein [Candidatus Polarisedimenticolia bacterium]
MTSRYLFRSIVLCALPTLLLAGCGGGTGSGNSQQPPPPTTYQLTVMAPAPGSGTVMSSPAGINCPGTCSASFSQGTKVTLTATPGSNYFFGGWNGNCTGTGICTITLTAAATVSALFNAGNGITVTLAGTGTGTVTSTPAGISCGTTCSSSFPPNTQVTLTETPSSNSMFSGWIGACSGTGACTIMLNGADTVTASFAPTNAYQSLNHIILFAQENRSLDHYFGAMLGYWSANGFGTGGQTFDGLPQFNPGGTAPSVPGCNLANDATGCSADPNNPISSFHFKSVCQENQSPFWNEAHNDWDLSDPTGSNPSDITKPPLDGFVYTAAYDARSNNFMDQNGVRAMGYFDDTDLNYYYFMASSFGTSDRWFSPVMSRTELNRMYMMAATTQGYAYPINSNSKDAAQLSATPIVEALQDAGITWKIYVEPDGTNCSGPPYDSACLIAHSYINMFTYYQTIVNSANGSGPNLLQNIVPVSQFAIDAQNNTLPQFALIEPASDAGLDEHPSDSDEYPSNVQKGAQYAAQQIINPLMTSQSWSDSALIFTYDEAGGFYDHVPPQPAVAPGDFLSPIDLQANLNDVCTGPGQLGTGICDFSWTGYRVPLIVISPYSVKNFVSHTVRDTTAVLKMVETRFGLAPLTARDAAQPDMLEFFDFVNKPWAAPPSPPLQTTTGYCSLKPDSTWVEPPVLTVTVSGSGSVASSPAGIDACTSTGGTCSAVFSAGTGVTLTATPATGSTFTGWSGASCTGTSPCSVTVNSAESVDATFAAIGAARVSGSGGTPR